MHLGDDAEKIQKMKSTKVIFIIQMATCLRGAQGDVNFYMTKSYHSLKFAYVMYAKSTIKREGTKRHLIATFVYF
jgi:hypothetical protein